VVLGLLLLPAIYFLLVHNPVLAVLQVLFSLSMLALLLGRAGMPRIVVASVVLGLYLTLEAVGLAGSMTGSNPIARAALTLRGDIEQDPITSVKGETFAYVLMAPANGRWYLRKPDAARKDNPLADRWLVRPDLDAHVLVIAEKVDGAEEIDTEAFHRVVLENARKAAKSFDVVEDGPLPDRQGAQLIHTKSVVQELQLESYYGLFASGPNIYQVVAFVPRERFGAVAPELKGIVASFTLP
jgi:hypothetical protein